MAQPAAISALEPDLAVLGRQHRAGALRRRSRPADDAILRQVDRRVCYAAAVRPALSRARLAGVARASSADGAALRDGLRRQQRAFLLGAAIYPGAERAVDPIIRTVIRGAVVAIVVRRAADLGTARRHRHLARRRADHHYARRSRSARRYPVQQRRRDVRRGAAGVRTVLGVDAAPAQDASAVADFLHHRLRRGAAVALLGLGILDWFHAEARPLDGRDPDLCGDLSLHAGLPVLQPGDRADWAEPRRALLSSGAGVRLGDGDPPARRIAAS